MRTVVADAVQTAITLPWTLGYAGCREDTFVVLERTPIISDQVFEGLILTGYLCDKQVDTSSI